MTARERKRHRIWTAVREFLQENQIEMRVLSMQLSCFEGTMGDLATKIVEVVEKAEKPGG